MSRTSRQSTADFIGHANQNAARAAERKVIPDVSDEDRTTASTAMNRLMTGRPLDEPDPDDAA